MSAVRCQTIQTKKKILVEAFSDLDKLRPKHYSIELKLFRKRRPQGLLFNRESSISLEWHSPYWFWSHYRSLFHTYPQKNPLHGARINFIRGLTSELYEVPWTESFSEFFRQEIQLLFGDVNYRYAQFSLQNNCDQIGWRTVNFVSPDDVVWSLGGAGEIFLFSSAFIKIKKLQCL